MYHTEKLNSENAVYYIITDKSNKINILLKKHILQIKNIYLNFPMCSSQIYLRLNFYKTFHEVVDLTSIKEGAQVWGAVRYSEVVWGLGFYFALLF